MLKAALYAALAAAVTAALSSLLGAKPLAALLASALAVDWVAAKAGGSFHEGPSKATLRGAAKGALIASGAVVVSLLALLVLGLARPVAHEVSLLTLGLGLLSALAQAVRDELTYRLLPSRAFEGQLAPLPRACLVIALSVAPALLSASPSAIAVASGQAALSTALLFRTGSLGGALGASTALVFLTQTLFSSTLEARFTRGALVPLSHASGPGAYALAAALLTAAAAYGLRRPR